MLTKLSIYAYDDGLTIRRDFDDSPTEHDWVEFGGTIPLTLRGWVDLAIDLREVTERKVEDATYVALEVISWTGKEGVTFRWDNDQE